MAINHKIAQMFVIFVLQEEQDYQYSERRKRERGKRNVGKEKKKMIE